MTTDASTVLKTRYHGETDRLALREDFRTPEQAGDLIAALANADGGNIIVGVTRSGVSVGVWPAKLQRFYATALEQVQPRPTTELHVTRDGGTDVGVIAVDRSAQLVISSGGVLVWSGTDTRAMTAAEIERKLLGVAPEPEPGVLAGTLARLTSRLDDLGQRAAIRDRPWTRYKEYVLAGLIGAVMAWLLQRFLGH